MSEKKKIEVEVHTVTLDRTVGEIMAEYDKTGEFNCQIVSDEVKKEKIDIPTAILTDSPVAEVSEGMSKILNYQGIIFAEWTEGDMDGQTTYWSNICPKCAEQYQYLLNSEIDFSTHSDACCGVCGCDYKGYEDANGGSHYIDFDPEDVKIEDKGEATQNDSNLNAEELKFIETANQLVTIMKKGNIKQEVIDKTLDRVIHLCYTDINEFKA